MVQPSLSAADDKDVAAPKAMITWQGAGFIRAGDVTYLPVRDIISACEMQVVWAEDEAENKLIITAPTGRYQLVLDMDANTVASSMNTYPFKLADGKVYLPVHFFADVLDNTVVWEKDTDKLLIFPKSDSTGRVTSLRNLPVYEKTVAARAAVVEERKNTSYHESGIASWYGADFHGGKTANGERYNMNAMTAAHKTLPFGTMVRVTAVDTGASVDVRINDRGPFIKGRVIDLSRAAASEIGLTSRGICRVTVEILH